MKRSFSIIIIFIALAIVGAALTMRLPVKLMPSRALPNITVSFSLPKAASRVVESEVTGKLEGALARIRGVKEINSRSATGSGSITIGFDKHTDMELARFEAATVIRQIWPQLPDGVSYPSIQAAKTISESSRPVLTYSVNSSWTPAEIMKYADDNLRPLIGKIKGVDRVTFSGATPKEWHLTYNYDQLRNLGLSPADISDAINLQNSTSYLGMASDDNGEWLPLRLKGGEFSFDEIPAAADSALVMLSQLLTIRHEDQEPSYFFRINGLNSVYCNIYAEENANQLEVAGKVKREISSLELPKGFAFNLLADTTSYISAELDKILFRTGLTLLILLLFVALISRNARYIAVITVSLILSLCISVIFYYILHVEIQLYSLAGITISMNLIIDNIIVMGDHYRRRRDLRTFTSVLAATLTTVGALGIVFFMEDEIRLNLQDFVAVVIINLSVSLATTLWLVPALIEVIGLGHEASRMKPRALRGSLRFYRFYGAYIRWGIRRRGMILTLTILLFGIPTFLLPARINDAALYNNTIGSETYQKKIKPWVDLILGGSWNLFAQHVFSGSYFNRGEGEPYIVINASLPSGSTIQQMDHLVKKMEMFLAEYKDVKQFRTEIYSPRRASITVTFTKEAGKTPFPHQLKAEVISKALTLGGGSWTVYGLENNVFNNSVSESAGSYQAKLLGYNYDELEAIARVLKTRLLSYRRIKEVTVGSEFSSFKDDYSEFHLDIDPLALAKMDITISDLYSALSPVFGRNMQCASPVGSPERILLSSTQSKDYDIWALMNIPMTVGGKTFKLSEIGRIEKVNAPREVIKENQQYKLCVQFDYVGSPKQAEKVLDAEIKRLRDEVPLGYTITNRRDLWNWRDASATNYWLLLLVIAIIFFTSAVLFNSIRLPLIIIFTIPISFIGVFLIFYLTKTNFDQGGFASFVLLCGITVNAAIYLINEFNRLRFRSSSAATPEHDNGRMPTVGTYLRAFRIKIIPILLTVVSTILGFLPFMIGTDGPEAFWFPLSIGTIGGLAASLAALLLILPIILLPKERRKGESGNP